MELKNYYKLRGSNNCLRLIAGFLGRIGTLFLAFGTKTILMEFFINSHKCDTENPNHAIFCKNRGIKLV